MAKKAKAADADSETTVLDESASIAEAAAWAKDHGAVRMETDAGEVWVLMPRLVRSRTNPFSDDAATRLLDPPVRRAAYSDRTAWLMAELSRLVYRRFESNLEERRAVAETLASADLELVDCIEGEAAGTQAYLVRAPGRFLALVFRGTEKDFKDVRADLDARFLGTAAGKAHRGFMEAFSAVETAVRESLKVALGKEDTSLPLYVAGHSLGGALATVAANRLEDEFDIAACYTFGSPRVGDAEWSDLVKAPVYRVVNGADGVPIVPGGPISRWVLEVVPKIPGLHLLKNACDAIKRKGFVGYQHVGDLRYLSGNADSAGLKTGSAAVGARLMNVTFSFAFGLLRLSIAQFSGYYRDHAIAQYALKLKMIAEDRNP